MKPFSKLSPVADRKVRMVYVEARPEVRVAEEFMREFTGMIRGQFCPDWDDRTWCQNLWMVRRAITYPAEWFNEKRIFVPARRYREILLTLIQDIKRNASGAIDYPPGYLLKCVQDHFRFHADEYNAEGKAARDAVRRIVEGARVVAGPADDELVKRLADAHRLIRPPGRRKKAKPTPAAAPSAQAPELNLPGL